MVGRAEHPRGLVGGWPAAQGRLRCRGLCFIGALYAGLGAGLRHHLGVKYFALSVFSVLIAPVLLAQHDESAAFKGLEDWLAEPRTERETMEKQAFAKAALTKEEAEKIQTLLWEDHAGLIRETRKAEIDAKKLKIGELFVVRHIGETLSLVNPASVLAGDGAKYLLMKKLNLKKDINLSSILLSLSLIHI